LKDPNLEKYDVASVAKKLVSSSESRAGPEPGEEPEAWIREAYLRLLLRPPSPEETQSALAAFKTAKEEAWRAILVLLATSNDYLTY
jgi:hypothetical protein